MKINFCLPPAELKGGPLAIMEYANGLIRRGHEVSITTYPVSFWPDKWKENLKPFPWYEFEGKLYFCDDRLYRDKIEKAKQYLLEYCGTPKTKNQAGYDHDIEELAIVLSLIDVFPDCDINIATIWLSAYAVYFSRKGKPVYFMQHYEEVFERKDYNKVLKVLSIRNTYSLPMYKIANSSWLQKVIYEKYGQKVPFSLNAINIDEFSPLYKLSSKDGIIRLLTYCDEREWKGFADVAYVVSKIYCKYGNTVEWHVFGKPHSRILPQNTSAPYIAHTGLSFGELAKLYAECDIMICGSWYESFPLPPLEAMASGTAVVTTKYGTEDYCFDNVNCLCVEPRVPKQMYEAIGRLIDDPVLRRKLVERGLETASKFSWETAVDVREKYLEEIYNNSTDYNRFEPIGTGFVDGNGIDFMRMPKDMEAHYPNGMYICQNDRLFIIQDNCKRLIANSELIDEIYASGVKIQVINEVECMRIPMGFTVWDKKDIL